jgi:hypothetical protein
MLLQPGMCSFLIYFQSGTIAGLWQKYDKVKIFIKYFCYNAANIWGILVKKRDSPIIPNHSK